MKYTRMTGRIGKVLYLSTASLFTCGALFSQSTADLDDEEIFELSPFTVETSEDSGYYASSTLAGSRLNTSLKDVAASVSIVTPELMEDLGADDIENAMAYVAGVETALTTETAVVSSGGELGGSISSSPSGNRVRGLTSADVTMDFFQVSNGNLDRYNVERITLVRGPNSVLFGLGSPAGIIDYTTKKAHFGKNRKEIGVQFDSFGSRRVTADFNQVVLEDKLAVRVMGLYDEGRAQFDRHFDNDKRYTVAATYKPFEKTTIRIGFENARNDSRRARYIPPRDYLTGWAQAGSTTWNPVEYAGLDPIDVYGRTDQGLSLDEMRNIQSHFYMAYTDLNGADSDYTNYTAIIGTEWVVLDPKIQFLRSASPLESVQTVHSLVSDEGVFPFQDVDIATLGQSYNNQDNDKFYATIEQQILEKLHVELGYFKEEMVQDSYGHLDSSITVDVNETLANGEVNPNFMRPYLWGRGVGRYRERGSESWRVTTSYEFDFDEKFDNIVMRNLGRHRLTGLYSARLRTEWTHAWEPKIDQMNGPAITTHMMSANHRIGQLYYIADPLSPGQIHPNYTGFPGSNVGPYFEREFSLTYYDAELGAWDETDVKIQRKMHNSSASRNKSEVAGYGFALQSHFWDNKIVTTLGWRTDEISSWNIGEKNGPGTGSDGLLPEDISIPGWQFGPEPDTDPQSGETITKGIVFAPLDWLRFHYNESENFAVSAQKVNIFREPIAASGGTGKDWGFSVDLLDGKLIAKINWYESGQVNANTGAFGFTSSWGIQSVERQLYGYLNRNGRIAEWVHPLGDKDPNNTPYDLNYLKPSNVSDVNDFLSEGMELELIYNPTRNWRIAFNAAKVETTQQNSASDLIRYRDMRLPYLEQFFDENRNSNQTWGEWYWIRVGKPLANAEAANGKVSTALAKWSANVITNYKFLDGRLKGFAVGASARWREGATIGYPDIEDGGIIRSDLDNPYKGPELFNVGVHASYVKKIFDGKVDWKIQVNIKNLIGDDDLVPFIAHETGEIAANRVGRDRFIQISNTFKF